MENLRPLNFKIICAIARVVILRDPSMLDAEWKAATKDTIAKQRFEEPGADMLQRAIGAVERALHATMGPRPLPSVPSRPTPAKAPPLTPADWSAMADTVKRILARSHGRPENNVVRLPAETLSVSEFEALDVFYLEAQTDRLAALKRFAEIAITRPDDWDVVEVRAKAGERRFTSTGECYGCRAQARQLNWHHIIQVQHGGSNTPRNQCAICDGCHAMVHPWLPKRPRAKAGFVRLGDMGWQPRDVIEIARRAAQRRRADAS